MPSKLAFCPVVSVMACTFSSTLPIATTVLSREIGQCLTQGQMVSTDPCHTHTCTTIIIQLSYYTSLTVREAVVKACLLTTSLIDALLALVAALEIT